jgi:hypothetical protein
MSRCPVGARHQSSFNGKRYGEQDQAEKLAHGNIQGSLLSHGWAGRAIIVHTVAKPLANAKLAQGTLPKVSGRVDQGRYGGNATRQRQG